MAFSFATIRFFAVIRQTVNVPVVSCPQKWVKPRKVKVSGFPSPRCFRFRAANRPNSISLVLSGCNSKPNFASRSRNSRRNRSASVRCSKTHHKIVSVADDNHVAVCHFLAPGFNPQIENIMQVYVREQR